LIDEDVQAVDQHKKSKASAIAEALLPPYEKYTHNKNSILFITSIIFIVKKILKKCRG
jgi:hypothetical protein